MSELTADFWKHRVCLWRWAALKYYRLSKQAQCGWCGYIGPREKVAKHILECVNHPMGELARSWLLEKEREAERDTERVAALEAEIARLRDTPATDLARKDIMDDCDLIVCKVCGCELEWIGCGVCDEGYIDGYDDDPLWYNPGDLVRCYECGGTGGWLECLNIEHHITQQPHPADGAEPVETAKVTPAADA